MRSLLLLVMLAVAPVLAQQAPVQITEEQTAALAIKRVEPTYPALAKKAKVEGVVRLKVWIDRTGKVERVDVLSGHPLLTTAAQETARQWSFNPFLADGQPVPVVTEIQITFRLEIPEKERDLRAEFHQLSSQGEQALDGKDYAKAEQLLRQAVKLGEKLPDDDYLSVTTALQRLGAACLWQRKYGDAETYYRQELSILRKHMGPEEAEIGVSLINLAFVSEVTGRTKEAEASYRKAGDIFEKRAAETAQFQDMQRDYQHTLVRLWNQLSTLLAKQGRGKEAEALLTKSLELATRTGYDEYVDIIKRNLAALNPRQ